MRPQSGSRSANMSRNLINLLPPDRLHSFRREYFLRLATVVFFMLTFLVVVHGVLLVPSYLYLSSEESATQHELDSIADPATDSAGVTT